MNELEFEARVDAMLDAEYESLGGDKFREHVGDKKVHQMVLRGYAKRVEAERARDPEFNNAWIASIAGHDVDSYISRHRPTGTYRKDGVLKIGNNQCVFMKDATREHLLAWAMWEDNERNLAYIRSRLDVWDKRPECKTLDQLERDAFGWQPPGQ